MSPGCLEEEPEHCHEECIARGGRISGEAGGIIPEDEVYDARDDCPGNFWKYLCRAECEPVVDSRRMFSCFPESAVLVEFWNNAIDDCRWDEKDKEG